MLEHQRAHFELFGAEQFPGRRIDDPVGQYLPALASLDVLTPSDAGDGTYRRVPEVIDAWRSRFDRMKLLRAFCGSEFEKVREEFLGCLVHPGHRSEARVYCCIATK